MAKYDYDKKALKGLGYRKFLNEVKNREGIISEAEDLPVQADYNVNRLARALHPEKQYAVVTDIREYQGAKLFTLRADRTRGTERLAYFRAGQYVSVSLQIGDSFLTRPYSICSNPKWALDRENSRYQILVKQNPGGFAAPWILSEWKVGAEVTLSGPLGNFYYQELRDADCVVAAAGGSGITPFLSMAYAVAEGIEPFSLNILYGARTEANLVLRDELEKAALQSGGKVRLTYVLSEEKREGMEHGFLSAELMKKKADGTFSLFACGPQAMYRYLTEQAEILKLPKRFVRFEVSGGKSNPSGYPDFPKEQTGMVYQLTVRYHGEETLIPARAEETLLSAVERAGIRVTSECRNGQCGWCHSRLISGTVFIPEECDGRRIADKTYGWIHPCVSYPTSDLAIEVFPV